MTDGAEWIPGPEELLEYASCGLLVASIEGIIRRANTTFCRWLGYESAELVDKVRLQELITMGGRVFHETHWSPLLQLQGSVGEIQLDMIHRDGRRIPMLFNAVRRQRNGTIFDEISAFIASDRRAYERELLSARKTAENALTARQDVQLALQQSRDVLGVALRSAKMGVWSRNLSNRQVWLSRELEELLGFREGEFAEAQKDFQSLIFEDDRQTVSDVIDNALVSKSDYAVEFKIRHANGTWMPVEGRGRFSYGEDGKAAILFGVVIDISERLHNEYQLRQLNEKLSQADRRKDEFLATLAHELRNPLAPMRNVIEILKLRNIDDPKLLWAHEIFERQVNHMTHLVDDLMDVSRITMGRLQLRMQPTDLATAMKNAVETSRPTIDAASHLLTVEWPAAPVSISADPTRLTQMISNLLTNAAKYTPDGGTIVLSGVADGGFAKVTVRDSGIGIDRDNLAHIFDMFSQLAPALGRSQGGVGIGLALVRGLAQLHGGEISVNSEGAGKGSEFVIRLPLIQFGSPVLPLPARDGLVPSDTSCRILVVDDNADAAASLTMALEIMGYQVRSANDGLEGLQLAEQFRPDVALLDIGLPTLSGYDIARNIRSQPWGSGMFLIAATGWGQDKDKALAEDAGFNMHLTKPIDFTRLDAVLKQLVQRNPD